MFTIEIMRKNFFKRILGIAIVSCLLSACGKEAEFDVKGDPSTKVFFQSASTTVKDYNTYRFSIINTPAGTKGNVSLSLPVFTTLPSSGSLKVSMLVDNSLVATYNAQNGTDLKSVPADVIDLAAVRLNIAQGQQKSADSLKINIASAKLSLLTEKAYLLPVKIADVIGDTNTAVSSNQNVVYVIISTSFSELYDAPTNSEMVGSIIPDRSAWTATINQPLAGGDMQNIFDGDVNSYFFITSTPNTFIVDLNQNITGITGIRLKSYFSVYGLTETKLLSSIDGLNWTEYGSARVALGDSQYIQLYKGITARYLRLDITGWQNNFIALTEFDVYK